MAGKDVTAFEQIPSIQSDGLGNFKYAGASRPAVGAGRQGPVICPREACPLPSARSFTDREETGICLRVILTATGESQVLFPDVGL